MYEPVKRLIDITLAGVLLVLTAPLQLLISGLVRKNLGSPVLFKQRRPGENEEIFQLVKYRTMKEPEPHEELLTEEARAATDEDRLTRFGVWLRSTSLDELPTLWNVLKGDMSLVGPRPLLVCYLDHYSAEERRRHDVRPGITGLAQVRGRENLSWREKFALDIEYVETRSLKLDFVILAQTFLPVLRREATAPPGLLVSPMFTGHDETTSDGDDADAPGATPRKSGLG
jgi:lipopolysaccharide/colanic/teichoic acid biosynthesis glycosyltransferase